MLGFQTHYHGIEESESRKVERAQSPEDFLDILKQSADDIRDVLDRLADR